ncbi:YihY/virulence factor BrkB family protein [Ancylobacter sp. 6x-1]|uniref:YihY/virulence factor BrkB family protein n=1 Tax=Ancylobacter crimeensis TaxID=2579147 RepID=A0ABT0DEJ0_9HYPH|nr:YihY/virulence factor BrkB family protein [Ancylobacter crimeensis]MCK0198391.1 YihY/virulence factor BrkB family protein [Ancylobacter crimeensis]
MSGKRSVVRQSVDLVAVGGLLVVLAGWRRRYGHIAISAQGTALDAHHPGLAASSPVEIPARGWWSILKRVFSEFAGDRVLSLAAGVTFYALLAVFPALGAFIALYGLFFDPLQVQQQLDAAAWILPSGMIEVLRDQAMRVTSHGTQALGIGFAIGLVTALWSANAGTKSLIEALNIAYDEDESRSFLMLTLLSLALTVAGILIGIAALAAVVALPVALSFLHLDQNTEWLLRLLRWPALAVLVMALIAALYRYGPCRAHPRWRWVGAGAVAAAVLWLGVSAGFSWYVSHFASYNETYGSLGAVIGFMTWIWLSVTVILLGAELNVEIERQTARDTTTGHPRPLGTRGAYGADTVAAE